MSDLSFWTTLIKVHSSVEGNTALDENCTHVTGPYWIMEGETEFLTEEGVKFDDVAEGEVNATCAYHGGIETVKNGPNNEAFVKCKDGYGKEIETNE